MRETGDKAKRKQGGERSRGREKEEEEWEKTTPCPPPHRFRDSYLFTSAIKLPLLTCRVTHTLYQQWPE
jgi:hypothetical protein